MFELLKKYSGPSLSKPLLVCMSDGFGLLGTVVEPKSNQFAITAAARSNQTDAVASLIDVAQTLESQHGKLPNTAIMLHTHAIPSILELPIENVGKLDKNKLQELVRWEMESIFSDLIPHDNLGWLMIGHGFIDEEQRDHLIQQLETERKSSGKKIRLGELAIRDNYIDRDDLERCLKTQDEMQLQDQRIKYGWMPLDKSTNKHWIASAMSSAIHEKWVSAFKSVFGSKVKSKVDLKAFIPTIGSTAAMNPACSSAETYVIELHRAYLAVMNYQEGKLVKCLTLECSSDTPTLKDVESTIEEMEIPEKFDVSLFVSHSSRDELAQELCNHSRLNINPLRYEIPAAKITQKYLSLPQAMMISSTAQHYSRDLQKLLVPIEGQEPPPPIHKRKETKYAAAAAMVLACITSIEAYYYFQNKNNQSEILRLEDQISKQTKIKKDIKKSRKNTVTVEQLNIQYSDLVAFKKILERVLVARQKFMNVFLDIIVNSIEKNVIIDSIKERDWNSFVIEGWANDQKSIDIFSTNLSRNLESWNMYISENPSSLGRNQSGYSGYTFKLIINQRILQTTTNTPNLTKK